MNESNFGRELADLVVPLSYGIKGSEQLGQYYTDLWNYKIDPPVPIASGRLRLMLILYQELHHRCLEAAMGRAVDVVTWVPSGRSRQGENPLRSMADLFGRRIVPVRYVGPIRMERSKGIHPEYYEFDHLGGQSVLVLEDAWVQGNNAQSVAVAAKRAGAEVTSVVILGRVVDANFGDNREWIQNRIAEVQWDPLVCPVTGSECPPHT